MQGGSLLLLGWEGSKERLVAKRFFPFQQEQIERTVRETVRSVRVCAFREVSMPVYLFVTAITERQTANRSTPPQDWFSKRCRTGP